MINNFNSIYVSHMRTYLKYISPWYKTLFYLVYKWNVIFGFGHSFGGFIQCLNFLNPGKFE